MYGFYDEMNQDHQTHLKLLLPMLCYLTISKDPKHEADIKIRKFVLNLPTPSSFVFFISTFFNCSFYNSRKCFMEKQLWCESLV